MTLSQDFIKFRLIIFENKIIHIDSKGNKLSTIIN